MTNPSDHDFDRQFGEKMRQQTDLDFSHEDWPKIAARLDAADRRRWRVLPFWWLAGLTGLLVLSNLGWFLVFEKQKNATAEHSKTIILRDTIFEKTVVERVDTVYKTVVVRRFSENGLPKTSSGLSEKHSLVSHIPKGRGVMASQSQVSPPFGVGVGGEADVKKDEKQPLFEKTAGEKLDFPLFRKLPIDSPAPISIVKQLVFVPSPTANFQPNAAALVSKSWKPKWVAVGPSGGFLQPLAYRMLDRRGSVVGLTGEIGFSNRFSITFDAAQASVRCREIGRASCRERV